MGEVGALSGRSQAKRKTASPGAAIPNGVFVVLAIFLVVTLSLALWCRRSWSFCRERIDAMVAKPLADNKKSDEQFAAAHR